MSTQESKFIKYVGGIIAALMIYIIWNSITVLGGIDVIEAKTVENEKGIKETRQYHIDDTKLIRDNLKEIRFDQKEIKTDIKELLKRK